MFKPLKFLSLTLFVLGFWNSSSLGAEKFYCVQVSSFSKVGKRELSAYNRLKGKFPQVRIEKIGALYTIRVGFWKSLDEAKKAARELRALGFKESFPRNCYYIPSRWLYPKKTKPKKVKKVKEEGENRKLDRAREGKNKKDKNEELRELWRSILKSKVSLELPSQKVNFPESRVDRPKEKPFSAGVSSSVNRDLKTTFFKGFILYKGVGLGGIKRNGEEKGGLWLEELYKVIKLKDYGSFKFGAFKKSSFYENWNPLGGELFLDFTDKKFRAFLHYLPFRNYANDLDLKRLLTSGFSFAYLPEANVELELGLLYDGFKGRENPYPFKVGTRYYAALYAPNYYASLTLKGSDYGIKVYRRFSLGKVGLSYDSSLGLPPQSKGELFSGEGFAFDDFNTLRFDLTLKAGKGARFFFNYYYALDDDKPVILGDKPLKVDGNPLGFAVGGSYAAEFLKGEVKLSGALFLPQSGFKDESIKAGGYFNYRLLW